MLRRTKILIAMGLPFLAGAVATGIKWWPRVAGTHPGKDDTMAAVVDLVPEPLDCLYTPREGHLGAEPESGLQESCATIDRDGGLRVKPGHLLAMDFSADGLAVLGIKGGRWFYIKPDGASLEVLPQDNGPDNFEEGLVRVRREGRLAFFDRSFQMVIAPKYDFAWPFDDGMALACLGCRPAGPDPSDPEHHVALVGGTWGFIDHESREVLAVTHSRDEAWQWRETRR